MISLHKEASEIREELFEHIEDVQDDYINKGYIPKRLSLNNGIVRGLLEIFIFGIYQLYQQLNNVLKQATPHTSTGAWLDLHASCVDIKRLPATKSKGYITFIRGRQSINIKIPKNKIVRTPADTNGVHYRYITIEEVTLPVGENSIDVLAVAEEYGAKSNVTAGLINELVTPIPDIASVGNKTNWLTSEGADIESDKQLLDRYTLQWRSQAGVTSAAYQLAALGVIGVQSVKVFDQHPRGQGTIDIVVLGSSGVPTDKLISEVEAAISSKIIINDDVLVRKVEPVGVALDLMIEYTSGNTENIKAEADRLIRSRVMRISSNIGEDLILSRVIADVMDTRGIKRVVWQEPLNDITIEDGQIVQLESLAITMLEVASD